MTGELLRGQLVVALEQAVAAPYCTSRLADAGARVIKIERREGDFARRYDTAAAGQSSYFVWLNRGKESLVVDIKDADDRALLLNIIANADIVVQNLGPGVARRLGLDPGALRERHPSLIVASITGYGEHGEFADRKAYDLLVQAESGLCSVTGLPDGPGRVGVSVCDIAAGMYAYMGILESVVVRARTGEGSEISVSLFDSMAEWMTVPLLFEQYGHGSPPRLGLNHPSIAPYGMYPAGPEHNVLISVQNEQEWLNFVTIVLKRVDLAEDRRFASNAGRVDHRGELDAIIVPAMRAACRGEIIQRLREARIAYGELNGTRDVLHHPHLRLASVQTPNGPVPVVAPPVRRCGSSPLLGAVPTLGQHNSAIRKEFGLVAPPQGGASPRS